VFRHAFGTYEAVWQAWLPRAAALQDAGRDRSAERRRQVTRCRARSPPRSCVREPDATVLTDEEIKAAIKQAFKPFRCVVVILPDRQIRFRVLTRTQPTSIYTEPGIPIEVLREDSDLRELLRSVRRLLEKRGYQLSHW
jgi:hypothetical protein